MIKYGKKIEYLRASIDNAAHNFNQPNIKAVAKLIICNDLLQQIKELTEIAHELNDLHNAIELVRLEYEVEKLKSIVIKGIQNALNKIEATATGIY